MSEPDNWLEWLSQIGRAVTGDPAAIGFVLAGVGRIAKVAGLSPKMPLEGRVQTDLATELLAEAECLDPAHPRYRELITNALDAFMRARSFARAAKIGAVQVAQLELGAAACYELTGDPVSSRRWKERAYTTAEVAAVGLYPADTSATATKVAAAATGKRGTADALRALLIPLASELAADADTEVAIMSVEKIEELLRGPEPMLSGLVTEGDDDREPLSNNDIMGFMHP
ncbi:MAG: hypothetical protein QOH58_1709 [Thermoleophilaceae bacterium]|nr:hypothetical protein [Thermoleophilaceae bacterium]